MIELTKSPTQLCISERSQISLKHDQSPAIESWTWTQSHSLRLSEQSDSLKAKLFENIFKSFPNQPCQCTASQPVVQASIPDPEIFYGCCSFLPFHCNLRPLPSSPWACPFQKIPSIETSKCCRLKRAKAERNFKSCNTKNKNKKRMEVC